MHNPPVHSSPEAAARQPQRVLGPRDAGLPPAKHPEQGPHAVRTESKERSGPVGRFLLAGAMALALLLSVGFGPPILTDRNAAPIRLSPENVAALISSRVPPTVTAASVLMIDLPSGSTLFEKAPDEPRAPASTAKLMTALVVRDQAPLDEVVVITGAAAAMEGSRMGLAAGERLSVLDLLYGLLLPSGNDAAVALAEHVAGSEADFVAMMNAKAAALGLRSTHFANSHGLDAPGQVTTARDMALIASAALQDAELARIVAKPAAEVAGRTLANTNELLSAYADAAGVKTGTTDEAGECLVAAVRRGSHLVLLVELGSSARYEDARRLLDHAALAFAWRNVGLPDNGLSWITASNGDAYRLRSGPTSDIFVPAWQLSLLQPIVQIDAGRVLTGTEPVGRLRWQLGSESVADVPLSVWQGP